MQYATVEIHAGEGPKFHGIGASFYAYQLYISLFQGTASRIILTKGEKGPKKYLNAVEAGWHVTTGCLLVKLQINSDGFQKTGCQNMICKGFVQTSTRVTPGMVLDNLVELALSIYKDKFTSNWMLYNDNEHVGYWPKEIFNNMEDCSQVQMGGNAYSQINLPSPPMGNGVLNQAKFEKVFMIDGDGSKSKVPVDKVTTYNDLGEDYYGVSPDFENDMLHYGGPGGWTGI
ncbi:hypothetical protein C4D60_Mb07t12810 [Musa balbisiana]|uniref:Neprosin PEP catalytic domain-containing protein n=1 Tax=Musa balbisiana TaxID=52838 RepID=A0A4S8JEX4_MUSBA|nr:hypothetical protein C4D60_Mb07t12810 [Musa balbisiana]